MRCQMGGPSSARTVWATAAEVVNVRINSDSYRPWEGDPAAQPGRWPAANSPRGSPVAWATRRMRDRERGLSRSHKALARARRTSSRKRSPDGSLAGCCWPETQSRLVAGAGRSSAPMRDFRGSTRTGWEAPISGPELYKHMFSEVCGSVRRSIGSLVNPASAGPAAREGLAQVDGRHESNRTHGSSNPNSPAYLERPVSDHAPAPGRGGQRPGGRGRCMFWSRPDLRKRTRPIYWGGTEMARGWTLADSTVDALALSRRA